MGFDIQLFKNKNISDEFICSICQEVLREPLMIDKCEHIFCGGCIKHWILQQGVCPLDRQNISNLSLRQPIRSFRNLLLSLEIKCNYHHMGCNKYITLQDLETHSNICEYGIEKEVQCICGQMIKKSSVPQHKSNCVIYLTRELEKSTENVNQMRHEIIKLEDTVEELKSEIRENNNTIFDEWNKNKSMEISYSDMDMQMKNEAKNILTREMNNKNPDVLNVLCLEFNEKFGGEWIAIFGSQLVCSNFHSDAIIGCKIGKQNILFYKNYRYKDIKQIRKSLEIFDTKIKNKIFDEELLNHWGYTWNVTDESLKCCEYFLENNGLKHFTECGKLFSSEYNLIAKILGVIANVSEWQKLRHKLMQTEYIHMFNEYLKSNNITVAINSVTILCHLISDGIKVWKQNLSSKLYSELLSQIKQTIDLWKLDDKLDLVINYNSFMPIMRLLQTNISEVQYFAFWLLNYFTKIDRKRYFSVLEEENGISVIKKVVSNQKIDFVKKESQILLNNYEEYKISFRN